MRDIVSKNNAEHVDDNDNRDEEILNSGFLDQSYMHPKVNEYSSLKESKLYSWGELSPKLLFMCLGGLCLVTFTILAAPISAASFNPSKDPVRFVLAVGIVTLPLVSLIVLRIYLGWSYVGDMLLLAVIPYEESGWYDGQMSVKPPEMLLVLCKVFLLP